MKASHGPSTASNLPRWQTSLGPMILARHLLAVSILGLGIVLPHPALAKPPIWIVRDADSQMMLFGSVHVLPAKLNWQPKALRREVAQADDLWFELPVRPETGVEVQALVAEHGTLPDGTNLYSLLSPKAGVALRGAAERYGLSVELLGRLKPWFAEVALATSQYRASGASPETGVEEIVEAQAPETTQRHALETAREQILLFDQTSMDDQIASLETSLNELADEPSAFDHLVQAWMAGDLAGLTTHALAPLRKSSPGLYQRLVIDRNKHWVDELDERLKGSGKTVVIVGIGHLIGPDGVPARLRALGYQVTGP